MERCYIKTPIAIVVNMESESPTGRSLSGLYKSSASVSEIIFTWCGCKLCMVGHQRAISTNPLQLGGLYGLVFVEAHSFFNGFENRTKVTPNNSFFMNTRLKYLTFNYFFERIIQI